jgi:TolA-binding protein
MKWDWEKSREELLRYLALPRSESSEARARFYLGQVYYYTRDIREALFEFLSIQTQYPEEANEWIQATLAQLI